MPRLVIPFRPALLVGALVAAATLGCKSSDPSRNGTIPSGSTRPGVAPVGAARHDGGPPGAQSGTGDTSRSAAGQTSDSVRKPNGPATDSAAHRFLQRADRGRIQGDAAAPVWVIVASDFQCPFCRTWHAETYPVLVRDYVRTGKIRMAYLNYPLNMHKNAWPAAEAAMCASVQGMFWEMHDAIFANQARWSAMPNAASLFDSLAVHKFALNADEWRSCMSSHATAALVQADFERLRSAGVESTPSFFVGDRGISGAQPTDVFRAAIEQALAKARGAAPAAKPRR
ncbi:MAG: DsbA family protein [Gemmatimonadaceae bacterium]